MKLCSCVPRLEQSPLDADWFAAAADAVAAMDFRGVMLGYGKEWTVADARRARAAFAARGLTVREICAAYNLTPPTAEQRTESVEGIVRAMQLAQEMGCRCVAACSGGLNPQSFFFSHPDNRSPRAWQILVETCRAIGEAAGDLDVWLCVEPLIHNVVWSSQRLRQLVDEVDHPRIQAHMDPPNLVDYSTYFETARLIHEAFDLLGERIRSLHAKDTILQHRLTVHIDETVPGRGVLDYEAYLTRAAQLPDETPLVIEHLAAPADIQEAQRHIRSVAGRLGIPLD